MFSISKIPEYEPLTKFCVPTMLISASRRRELFFSNLVVSLFSCPNAFTTRAPVRLSFTWLFTARSALWRCPNCVQIRGRSFRPISMINGITTITIRVICHLILNIKPSETSMVRPLIKMLGSPSMKNPVILSASLITRVIRLPVCLERKKLMESLPIFPKMLFFISRTTLVTILAANTPWIMPMTMIVILAISMVSTTMSSAVINSPSCIPNFSKKALFFANTLSYSIVPLR